MKIKFIKIDEIIIIHKIQILKFGGQTGIRDKSLLISAINSPQTTFSGQYLHLDIYHMAATYMYNFFMQFLR